MKIYQINVPTLIQVLSSAELDIKMNKTWFLTSWNLEPCRSKCNVLVEPLQRREKSGAYGKF